MDSLQNLEKIRCQTGVMSFAATDDADVARSIKSAVLRWPEGDANGAELTIDYEYDNFLYVVVLKYVQERGIFSGEWHTTVGDYSGQAWCRIFRPEGESDITFVGRWTQDRVTYFWAGELQCEEEDG